MVDQALQDSGFLQRVEQTFEVQDLTQARLEEWLLHKKGPKAKGLSSSTRRLAKKLSETGDIYTEAQEEFDITQISKLEGLRKRASESPVYKEDLLDNIDEKLGIVREEDRITKDVQAIRDRVDELKSLPREELRDLFKTTTDSEERALARVALGEAQPQTLGG